ncbi:MAG: ribosomal subunit interface protein [Gammaproteobacteria bacterium CG11_big_fil_rev_8_21_14_0_20_46_22]|nr:MAG: ribosomal subunit interface protein [Gammaproteobacteria bacterium CG12_big_fil_rev_8_21_14_0_65_46_12]PIR10410.1 MAG: ribosomal subunit interface protein [Gammaproteobacteria bacterium CG11_big_fil_rev_8_21_14_0_20_46_22]
MTHITFTGHTIDVTDAIKDHTNQRFEKVQRHFDHITSAHMTIHVEKLDNIAEITIAVPGHQFHAKASSDDMYKSIDEMMKILNRQVVEHKEKISKHRD